MIKYRILSNMDMPALHGNWIDLIIVIITCLYLLGWGRGFLLGFIDLGGFLLSFVMGLKFYSFFGSLLAENFSLSQGISNALGFFLAGIAAESIFFILVNQFLIKIYRKGQVAKNRNKKVKILYQLDKIFGFIPAVGEAFIFVAFILTLVIALPLKGVIKKDITASKFGRPLINKTQQIEKQLNLIFGQAVNETLTFLTVNANPVSDESIQLDFTQSDLTADVTSETEMFNLINEERMRNGIQTLSFSFALQTLARNYARDMFEKGYFSHYNPEGKSPFDRMEEAKIEFLSAGENLALAPSVELAHQGLMNSPGHRANILSTDFKKVGIGVMDGGIYGEMFVQEFTD